jgi:predicted GIY-YIG superfamily endonuclease
MASRRVTTVIAWCGSRISSSFRKPLREKELKGWRRAKKLALIESMNPAWMDLSRDWYDCEPADYRRVLDRMDA